MKRIVDSLGWPNRIKRSALQLLLIIDYIFDWARDIYRENITSELRSLSASDTQSQAIDSDVFSMLDRLNYSSMNMETGIGSDTEQPENEAPTAVEDGFRYFDSREVSFATQNTYDPVHVALPY